MRGNNLCNIMYNGKNIDELLPGYTTVNVEGRGLLAPILETIEIDGRDGDYILSQKYPARQIKIYFAILGNSNKERLSIVEQLDTLLRVDRNVEISFSDQEGYWLGRYSGGEDIRYDFYRGIGFYTIHCQNPYRHMPLLTYDTNPCQITPGLYKKLELSSIKLKASNTSEVRVTNSRTGEIISLKDLPDTGTIAIGTNNITLNGESIIDRLDESVSTWKGFKIEAGDVITVTGGSETKISIRRYL